MLAEKTFYKNEEKIDYGVDDDDEAEAVKDV